MRKSKNGQEYCTGFLTNVYVSGRFAGTYSGWISDASPNRPTMLWPTACRTLAYHALAYVPWFIVPWPTRALGQPLRILPPLPFQPRATSSGLAPHAHSPHPFTSCHLSVSTSCYLSLCTSSPSNPKKKHATMATGLRVDI